MDDFETSLNILAKTGMSKWKDFAFVNPSKRSNDTSTIARHVRKVVSILKAKFSSNFYENLPDDVTLVCKMNSTPFEGDRSLLSDGDLVPLQEAREFLSFLSVCVTSRKDFAINSLPLLVLCDGNVNRQKVHFLYIYKTSNLPSNSGDAFEFTVKTISIPGAFPKSKLETTPLMKLGRPLVLQPHLYGKTGGISPKDSSNNINISAWSKYMLFQSCNQQMKKLNTDDQKSYISIDIVTSQAELPLEFAKEKIENITLNICPIPGDYTSLAFGLFQQLNIIEGLLEAFGEEKQIKWRGNCAVENEENQPEMSDQFDGPIRDQVGHFLKNFGLQSTNKKKGNNEKDKEINDRKETMVLRTELDFTETLWNILKNVDNLEELIESLNIIIKQIKDENNYSYWLQPDNKTQLARLVKQSFKGRIDPPQLRSTTAIEWLIDIGIDTLYRHYLHFFGRHHLFNTHKLKQQYEEVDDVINDVTNVKLKKKFNILLKFHHIVELAVNCIHRINLNEKKLLELIDSSLDEYLTKEVDFTRIFHIDVTFKDIEYIWPSAEMLIWASSYTCQNQHGVKNTALACWTREFPLKGLTPGENPDASSDDKLYMATIKQSVHLC